MSISISAIATTVTHRWRKRWRRSRAPSKAARDQGVGVYIDQVYLSRVAVATLDFLDVSQIETLRGPQGTLYGKNTVAGAINITSKAPSFNFEGRAELSVGNLEFKQAKASISGPLDVSRTTNCSAGAPFTKMVSTRVTTVSQPAGVRTWPGLAASISTLTRST